MKPRYFFCLACLAIGSCLYAAGPEAESAPGSSSNNIQQVAVQSSAMSQAEPDLDLQIPIARKDMTITESIQHEGLTAEDIGQNYSFRTISKDLSQALEEYDRTQSSSQADTARDHIRNVLIGLILELIITLIVLQIAFSLSGFPFLFHQIALLALAVAIPGALLEYFLSVGLLNPIRMGLGFILLLLLIRPLSDIRDWATAIRIALLARLISIGIMWLAFAGVMVLFGL